MKTQEYVYREIVSPEAEDKLLGLLGVLFEPVAGRYLEFSTLRHNFEEASEGGMPREDRTIDAETADYMIDHFALIYFGLIICEDFRKALKDATVVEIALDKEDEQFTAEVRRNMKRDRKQQKPSRGSCVINLGKFNKEDYQQFFGRLNASFERAGSYYEAIESASDELDDKARLDIGFITANFMYLLRAVARNELFVDYVECVIDRVKIDLGL